MALSGSCHCGRIAFTVEGEVGQAVDCNCSICRRRGSVLAFFPRDAFALTAGDGDYATYRFNTERIAHHFCRTCGVAPFSEATDPKSGQPMVAVNLRCVDGIDLAALEPYHYDGAAL